MWDELSSAYGRVQHQRKISQRCIPLVIPFTEHVTLVSSASSRIYRDPAAPPAGSSTLPVHSDELFSHLCELDVRSRVTQVFARVTLNIDQHSGSALLMLENTTREHHCSAHAIRRQRSLDCHFSATLGPSLVRLALASSPHQPPLRFLP